MNAIADLAFERFRGTRPLIIKTDAMAPTLRPGKHVAMVAPVKGYAGDGLYAMIGPMGGIDVYRVQPTAGRRLRLIRDNAVYAGDDVLTEDQFKEAVLGKIIGVVEFFDCDAYGAFVGGLAQ